MFDTARLDQSGVLDRADIDPITDLGRRAAAAGLRTASLDEVLCQVSSGRTGLQRAEVIPPAAATAPTVHRFCISHMQPLIPEGWYDHCIALGNYQPDSLSHVSQLDTFWHEARPIAYGAANAAIDALPGQDGVDGPKT